jgi:adenylate kinase
MEIVESFLIENKNGNVLFDGFPRTMNQALMLERSLAQLDMSIDIALEMQLSEEEITKRLLNRRHCSNCGKIYNYITNPPKKLGLCDNCGQKLIKRVDDSEDVVKRRLKIYEEETKHLVDYYKSLSVYKTIDAKGSQEEIFKRISGIINEYINKR